ncbi:MAG: nitroreductase family protein [Myxococcota bacterium]
MAKTPHVPLAFHRRPLEEMRERSERTLEVARGRRSVRVFSREPIPLDVVERCVAAAATAPSGAHKQPWTFCLVTDPALKSKIRVAAEAEEREFYAHRAPASWLADLAPFATTADKPFLEDAPALIVVMAQRFGATREDAHYYVSESVGIATGMLIAALNDAGLATLTHTPSPMKFLAELLGRPASERPFLLLPVGYPAEGCEVPDLARKSLDQVLVRYEGSPP